MRRMRCPVLVPTKIGTMSARWPMFEGGTSFSSRSCSITPSTVSACIVDASE